MMPFDADHIAATVRARHEQQPFSGVVQVRAGGRALFADAFGLADRAEGVKNTTDTRFGTASGTKTFTAIAVLRLIEAGRLSLDTRLTEVMDVPLPHFDTGITIHHLLTHTSGAPDYFDEEELDAQADSNAAFNDLPLSRVRRPEDLLPLFVNEPMKSIPGEDFRYNNGGYVLLGRVIELVSGSGYAEFVEEEVFARAGMSDAGFFEQGHLPARTALGYLPDGRTNVHDLTARGMPDGGAYVTAPDMAAFWGALLGGGLLGVESTARVLQPHVPVEPGEEDGRHYGLGIWLDLTEGAVTRYTCTGADPGVSFVSSYLPRSAIDVTVISNRDADAWPMFAALKRSLAADAK